MKINVTVEHIKRGVPASPRACPVALALRERGFDVMFTGAYALWYNLDVITMPEEVLDFAAAFDAGKPVEPFSFELVL